MRWSSLEETAVLISKVAVSEQSNGFGINVPVEMDSMKQNVLVYVCVWREIYIRGSYRETC